MPGPTPGPDGFELIGRDLVPKGKNARAVPPEALAARLTICESCPNLLPAIRKCGLCGCPIDTRARWRDRTCPDRPSRWSIL